MICMVWQRRGQPGEGRASRELCTFYTFVLCTALLILHPITLLLEPICKKRLWKFICVYVNNTTRKRERKTICNNVQMSFFPIYVRFCFVLAPFVFKSLFCFPPFWVLLSSGFMGALILQQRSEGYRSILSIRYVALPSKLGVSTKIITVVFFALVLDA